MVARGACTGLSVFSFAISMCSSARLKPLQLCMQRMRMDMKTKDGQVYQIALSLPAGDVMCCLYFILCYDTYFTFRCVMVILRHKAKLDLDYDCFNWLPTRQSCKTVKCYYLYICNELSTYSEHIYSFRALFCYLRIQLVTMFFR